MSTLDAALSTIEAPVGSRWYAWGKHYIVVEETSRDGEPAVRLKLDNEARQSGKRAKGWTVITRLLAKHGRRTG